MAQEALKRATRATTRSKERGLQEANAAVYYKAFRFLSPESRRLALRILQGEDLHEDLYDRFLIQQAEKEKGCDVLWEDYIATRQRHRGEET